MLSSVANTRGLVVEVRPEYLEEHSDPANSLWVHAYHVSIHNRGDSAVKLVSRHWIITDSDGRQEHVRGPGVVGQKPVIRPGESFSYTSGCPLSTCLGTMHGTYQVVDADGNEFDVEIAPFALCESYALN